MILRSLAAAVTVMLTACASGGGGSPSAADVLLSGLPSPLPQTLATGQELNSADAATATPADPTAMATFLGGTSFADAYERVWTQTPNQDYVTLLAMLFNQAADSARMVQFEVNQLSRGTNTYVEPHAAIPGSYVFVIHGPTRVGASPVNCEGVWMAVDHFAVETLTCSVQGAWATAAEDLAAQEKSLVQQAGG